jgi:predicted nucleic acid-binding protein
MEGLEKAVVDASVVVKWFNQEEFTEEALLLRQRICRGTVTPFAPELMIFEVANSLRYNPDFGAVDVQEAVRSLRDMQFPTAPMDEDMWRQSTLHSRGA